MRRASTFAATFALLVTTAVLTPSPAGARGVPLWVKHVRNYPGGISGSVRARLVAIQADTSAAALQPVPGTDVQMNDDCDPPLPQNEASVAINVFDQDNAVAAANDFCGDGFWIGHTTDGGDTWI